MPLLSSTDFKPPFLLRNRQHWQTIVPSIFRKIKDVPYVRERINTPDGDFIDIDWHRPHVPQSGHLIIVGHGLEGSSDRHYVKGLIQIFAQMGWHGLGWNCRSCSGEMNRLPRFYHHGDTPDLHHVVKHAINSGQYHSIVLAGFSLGGSIVLKYFGENSAPLPEQVKAGLAFSVPCDLASCGRELSRPNKMFYTRRFLRKLRQKIEAKAHLMSPDMQPEQFRYIKNFSDFDNIYTAPLHGFANADHYYASVSANNFLEGINRPVLLLNALNDPFLTPSCFPHQIAQTHRYLHLEVPQQGGHVGFQIAGTLHTYAELRAAEWIASLSRI